MLNHETLDVYQVALELDAKLTQIMPKRGHASLRDQLDRASAGIVANIAEGVGRRTAADKLHFYAIARGSATESAALLDMLRNRAAVTDEDHATCRALLIRVVQMLCRLCDSCDVGRGR